MYLRGERPVWNSWHNVSLKVKKLTNLHMVDTVSLKIKGNYVHADVVETSDSLSENVFDHFVVENVRDVSTGESLKITSAVRRAVINQYLRAQEGEVGAFDGFEVDGISDEDPYGPGEDPDLEDL